MSENKVRMLIVVDGEYKWVPSGFLREIEIAAGGEVVYVAGAVEGEDGAIFVREGTVLFHRNMFYGLALCGRALTEEMCALIEESQKVDEKDIAEIRAENGLPA